MANLILPSRRIVRPSVYTPINKANRQANGLVGFWPLNEGFGTEARDVSGQGNTGTLTNGPTWTIGKLGKVLSFDGVNDYIDISPSVAVVQSHSKGAVIARFKANALKDSCAIMFGSSADNKQCGRITTISTGKIYCAVYNQAEGGVKWDLVTVNAFDYVSSEIQVAIVQDGVGAVLYVNGIPQPCTSPSGTPVPGAWFSSVTGLNKASIGRFSNYALTGDYFNGYISDVRIYNRVLSAAEIKDIYANPYDIYAEPLRRIWLSHVTAVELTLSGATLSTSQSQPIAALGGVLAGTLLGANGGSASPSLLCQLDGQTQSASIGELLPSFLQPLQGLEVSPVSGTLSVGGMTVGLAGNLLSAAYGSIIPYIITGFDGGQSDVSMGGISATLSPTANGQGITGAQGTFSKAMGKALDGMGLSFDPGILVPEIIRLLAGQGMTTDQGALSATININVNGQQLSIYIGNMVVDYDFDAASVEWIIYEQPSNRIIACSANNSIIIANP